MRARLLTTGYNRGEDQDMTSTQTKLTIPVIALIVAFVVTFVARTAYSMGIIDACGMACDDSFIIIKDECMCLPDQYTEHTTETSE